MKRTIIAVMIIGSAALSLTALAQRAKEAETLLHRGVQFEEVKGELKAAISIYEQIVKDYSDIRAVAAKAYYHLGVCFEKLGRTQAAEAFQAIVEKYPDQTETVLLAREKLSLLERAETRGEKSDQELKISLVWQGPDMDPSGEISPDGRYLSYVDWPAGGLAIRETATGNVRRLTSKKDSPPGCDEFADWSIWAPDSKTIAYAWYSSNPDFYELRIIGIDDSKPRALFRGDYHDNFAHPCDWTPDGRYILAEITRDGSSGSSGLGLISVADGSIRPIAGRNRDRGRVKFSPDGRYIVFDQAQAPNGIKTNISIIAVEGREETVLVEHPSDDKLLGWAPDGGSVLFLSDRTGTWDAWMIRVAEGKPLGVPRLIKRELGRIKPMGLTRGGSLYYSTPGFEWDIFSAGLDPSSGKITDPPKKVPLLHEGRNTFPALSPNGKRLAYMSERPGTRGDVLCVFSFETGETIEIQPKGIFRMFAFPRWMPDGNSLLISGEEATRGRGFFKVDLQTGALTDFLNFDGVFGKDQAGFVRAIRISDDARSIYYLYHGPDRSCRVMTRRLGSTDEKEICRFPLNDPSNTNRLQLSPDETKLALALRDGEDTVLKVFPSAGGEIREILRAGQAGGFEGFVWSQDGRYIYFNKRVDPEHDQWKTELWRVSSSGGNAKNLGLTSNHFVNLCVHPDGQKIFYASRTADEQVGAVWAMENFLPSEKPKDIMVRRIFQGTGRGFVGSPSPDGRLFSDIDGKTGNLAVRDLASGSVRLLTTAPGAWDEYALYSVFSADGTKLAYTWFNKEAKFEIRTIGVDGTGVRTAFAGIDAIDIGPVGWSPDGRNILAFVSKVGGISEIVMISAGNGSSRVLKKLDGSRLGTVRLSPDGRIVAYDRVDEKRAHGLDIFLLPVAGGEETPLVSHKAMDGLLGWTPDGKGILFASDRTGSIDAWLIPVADGHASGDPVLVRKGLGAIASLGFDRKGSFYYGLQAQTSDVYIASVDFEAGKVISPPAPVAKRSVGSNDSPGWSPDGKTLAYVLRSPSAAASLLCLHSIESGEERDIAPKMYVRWPQWSPDGRKILVWGRKDPADYGFYFIDPETGAVSPFVLSTDTHTVLRAAWSPDGKAVYFYRFANARQGESRLIKREIETGRETEILRDHLITGVAVSPDGRNIAFRSFDDPDITLMIMPSSGGDIRELVRVKKPDIISGPDAPSWTPDGRYLVYPMTRNDGQGKARTELWRLDPKTKEAKPLGLTMDNVYSLALHPDLKRIAFESGIPKVEIWVMENFFEKN